MVFEFNFNTLADIIEKTVPGVSIKRKTVSQMVTPDGINIYRNISGHENELNYVVYDMGEKVTGLTKHVISLTILEPGQVNGEFKMTTGHSHPEEKIYMFLRGEGNLALKYQDSNEETYPMNHGKVMAIPGWIWHRLVNTGKKPLHVLCFFEKYGDKG